MGIYYLVHASGYQRKNHKYIRRTGSPGHYSYVYEDGSTSSNNANVSDEYKQELAANSGKNVSVNYSNNTPRNNVSDEYKQELAANSGKNVSVNYSNNTPRNNVSDEYKQELAANSGKNVSTNYSNNTPRNVSTNYSNNTPRNVSTNYSNNRGNHTIKTTQKITIKEKDPTIAEQYKRDVQSGNNDLLVARWLDNLKERPKMPNLKSIATNEYIDPKVRKEAAKLHVQENAGKKIRVSDVTKSFSKALATSELGSSRYRKKAAKLNVSENKPQKIIDKLKDKLIKFL